MSASSGFLGTLDQAQKSPIGNVIKLAGLLTLARCGSVEPYAAENNYIVGIEVPLGTDISRLPPSVLPLPAKNPNNMLLGFGFCSRNIGLIDMSCTSFVTGAQVNISSGDFQAVRAFAMTTGAIAELISSVASIKFSFTNQNNGTSIDVGAPTTNVKTGDVRTSTKVESTNDVSAAAAAAAKNKTGVTDTFAPTNTFRPSATNTFAPKYVAPSPASPPMGHYPPPGGHDQTPPSNPYQQNNGKPGRNTSSIEMTIPGYRSVRVAVGFAPAPV